MTKFTTADCKALIAEEIEDYDGECDERQIKRLRKYKDDWGRIAREFTYNNEDWEPISGSRIIVTEMNGSLCVDIHGWPALASSFYFDFNNTGDVMYITPKDYYDETGYLFDNDISRYIEGFLPAGVEENSDCHFSYHGPRNDMEEKMKKIGFVKKSMYF